MKNFTLVCSIILACCFAQSDATAQKINSHHYNDSCTGHVTFYWVTQTSPGMTMTTFFGNGDSAVSPSTKFGEPYQYTTPGTYTAKHVLKDNSGASLDTVTFTVNVSHCKALDIIMFQDDNTNCTRDLPAESLFSALIDVQVDSAGTIIDTIQVFGHRRMLVKPGVLYKLKVLNVPGGTSLACTPGGIINVTIPINTTSPTVVYIPLNCNTGSGYDLAVGPVTARYRPVNVSSVNAIITNKFCSAKNAVVTMAFSSKYNFSSALPTPSNVTGNVITWNLSNISATSAKGITAYFTPATTLSLGDTICTAISVSPTSGDVDIANNTFNRCDSVRLSYDPNSKEVIPQGLTGSGKNLQYTINFENLGNDTAFNIHIMDTLSQHLDVKSFELVYASHSVSPYFIKTPAGTDIIKFDFPNINLADSNNKSANKGFVTFNIRTKNNLLPNTLIPNRAGIYFDINPVVMTNTALNWTAPVGINSVYAENDVHVYPNPNDGTFTVQVNAKAYTEAKLMNTFGQLVRTYNIDNDKTVINIASQPAGTYYLIVTGSEKTIVEKIEKQ